jgi:hypothetical protein
VLGCSIGQANVGMMFSLVRCAYDFLWLYLLSVEGTGQVSGTAKKASF